MMRVPSFAYHAPESVEEAARILASEGPDARILAGGTDLVPNMKRMQQRPKTLVSLRRIAELRTHETADGVRTVGASMPLEDLVAARELSETHHAFWRAAAQVATPLIRTQATIGGNLCLDTRCNYYNQNYDWRQSIDYCMKAPRDTEGAYSDLPIIGAHPQTPGNVCWVAPSGERCYAVSSSDSAPALIALDAEIDLVSAEGTRRIALSELYNDDGIKFLTKKAGEILTHVHVPVREGWTSTYWKLRRRGSFDFPIAGVAIALKLAKDGVEDARIVLGALQSAPVRCTAAEDELKGSSFTDDRIEAAAAAARKAARPMDNTDLVLGWRHKVAPKMVAGALKALRGDDPDTLGVMARHTQRSIPLPVL